MKLYLASWLEQSQGVSLTNQNAIHRLLSFFFLKQYKGDSCEYLRNYVKTGIGIENKK